MKRAKRTTIIRRRRPRAVPLTLRADLLAAGVRIGTAEVTLALPPEMLQVVGPWAFEQVKAWTEKQIARGASPKVNAPGSGWPS